MRLWLLNALLFTMLGLEVSAVPFLKNIQLSSFEVYSESMRVLDPDLDPEPTKVAEYRFTVDITASISADEAVLFDEDTQVNIRVGDFSFDSTLGASLDFDPLNRTAVFDNFRVFDVNTEEFQYGRITANWSSLTSLVIRVTFDTNSSEDGVRFFDAFGQPDYTLWAFRNALGDAPNPAVTEEDSVDLTFGPYTQPPVTTYFAHGNSTVTGDDSLIRIVLYGGTDSQNPTSVITAPALPGVGGGNLKTYYVDRLLFEGTVRDTYRVGTASSGPTTHISSVAPTVEYFLAETNQLPADAVWKPATVGVTTDSNGNWSWQSPGQEILFPGNNFLFTRITDNESNVVQPSFRQFKYSTEGLLTVTGLATGFSIADNGNVVGTVKGVGAVFPHPQLISIRANNSPIPQPDTETVEAGTAASAIAKSATNGIFNGWTAKIGSVDFPLDPVEAVKERINFLTRPNLTMIANFAPNPFLAMGTGAYFGITSGATAGDRGTFVGKISKNGAFSGKIKLGALTLPVKGKFLASGFWTGVITKKGVTYTVTLNAVSSPQQITGTIIATGLNAAITADLLTWKAKTNEATDYVGTYNVLLPATANTGAVPDGVGYGQVKISKLGKVKFVGKIGDGVSISFSSFLYERTATEAVFPFFATVAKKLGSISGTVTHDPTQPNTDLTGNLIWFKPVTLKVEPGQIDGQIALHGSKYTAPAKGTRVILAATGAGALSIRGPSFSVPTTGATAFISANVTLGADNKLAPVTDAATIQKVVMKFAPSSGLFSGKFYDPNLKKTYSFSGAATQKANGGEGAAAGVFTRGNRAGYVKLDPAL